MTCTRLTAMMDLPGTLSNKVQAFMKNNEQLPQDLMDDIYRDLSKPQKELADLDAEIEDLSGRLAQLKKKREQLQKHISQYDHVLSPIRRLPTDILHEIFYHCLPTRRDPIMSAKEAPLLLTRVCRTWRQTAHASPPLWARLYITFSDEDLLPDAQISHGLTQKTIADTLRLRCIAVEEWLSRSGACPLSISLFYTSRIWVSMTELSPGKSDNTLTLFRILSRFSTRWQRLDLDMPIEVYRILERMVEIPQLPMLNSIRTSFLRQNEREDTTETQSSIALWEAQNLKRMSLNIHAFPSTPILSNPNLEKLTSLSLNWMVLVPKAISLLKNCPNLEYFLLTLMSDFLQVYPVPPPPTTHDVISLPHLRALSIVDAAHPNSAQMLYDRIDAPRLEWLDYTKEVGFIGRDYDYLNRITIIPFLQRVPTLRKFTLAGSNLSTTELRRILRSTQSITHLVFGPETRRNDNSLAPAPSPFISSHSIWNLGDLFLQDGEEEEEEMGYREPGVTLVPCLEILEISQFASAHVTDEVLRDIILRRADLIASNDVAPLKKVAALFSRARNIDLSKELSAHLNTAKIELMLDYLNEDQQTGLHFVSSGYGMDDLDRTWHYRDIEEEMMFA